MTRLLHAAARGARIEGEICGKWLPVSYARLEWSKDKRPYRIHPDDEHLQYGPISTALRIFGMGGDDPYTLSSLLALNAYMYESPETSDSTLQRSLFLLILAEALADEGL